MTYHGLPLKTKSKKEAKHSLVDTTKENPALWFKNHHFLPQILESQSQRISETAGDEQDKERQEPVRQERSPCPYQRTQLWELPCPGGPGAFTGGLKVLTLLRDHDGPLMGPHVMGSCMELEGIKDS